MCQILCLTLFICQCFHFSSYHSLRSYVVVFFTLLSLFWNILVYIILLYFYLPVIDELSFSSFFFLILSFWVLFSSFTLLFCTHNTKKQCQHQKLLINSSCCVLRLPFRLLVSHRFHLPYSFVNL